MDFKLGAKTIEFVPMTWKTQKQVFSFIVRGIALKAEAKGLIAKMVGAVVSGGEKVPMDLIVDTLESIPELMDKVLTTGLGVSQEDIDEASGLQVLEALSILVSQNELAEQMVKAKKAFTLLANKPTEQGAA